MNADLLSSSAEPAAARDGYDVVVNKLMPRANLSAASNSMSDNFEFFQKASFFKAVAFLFSRFTERCIHCFETESTAKPSKV